MPIFSENLGYLGSGERKGAREIVLERDSGRFPLGLVCLGEVGEMG